MECMQMSSRHRRLPQAATREQSQGTINCYQLVRAVLTAMKSITTVAIALICATPTVLAMAVDAVKRSPTRS